MSRSPLGGIISLILLGGWWLGKRYTKQHGFVVPGHRLIQPRSRILIWSTYILWIGILIASLQVHIPVENTERSERSALVQIVLDVSLSMSATDIAPNRWSAAQQGIEHFLINSAPGPTSLITFSGIPLLSTPRSSSLQGLAALIAELNLGDYPLVNIDFFGTAGGDALAVAIENVVIKSQQIQKEQKTDLPKIIIRITDGYSNKGINPLEILPYLQQENIQVWALGIGNTNTVIGKDRQGTPVTTPIDFDILQTIGEKTNGFFVKAENADDIRKFFDKATSELIGYTQTVSQIAFVQMNMILIPILIATLLLVIGIRIGLLVRTKINI